jgi:hypothetical protein
MIIPAIVNRGLKATLKAHFASELLSFLLKKTVNF